MGSSFRISRPTVTVPLTPASTTGTSATVADANINGILMGVIINPGGFDSATVAVSDSTTISENVDRLRANARDITTSDATSISDRPVAVEA